MIFGAKLLSDVDGVLIHSSDIWFFWNPAYFALFELIFLLIFFSLSSKSAFFTKLAILSLVANFAFVILAVKFSFVKLITSVA